MSLIEATILLFKRLNDVARVHGGSVTDVSSFDNGSSHGTDTNGLPGQIALALQGLSKQLVIVMHENEQDWPAATLSALADATRAEPLWRHHFGLGKRVGGADALPTALEPDCILELARLVISSEQYSRHSDLLRPALRLTANCCADDNTNRSLFVHRNGIASLKRLVLVERELDLLLPTIFNVCTDYDEVSMDANGNPMRVDDQMGESIEISMAEAQLGQYVDFPEGQTTAIEMWCKVPANHEAFLADLFELSSRPALYGGVDALSKATSDILEKTRMICAFLIRAQNIKDMDDFKEKVQSRHSIYIACMNLLSSRDAKVMLAQSPKTFWRFAQLFWDMESTGTNKEFEEAFMRIIYSVTELPEYSAAFTIESEAFGALVNHYNLIATAQGSSVQQIQSITVMLANCFTSPDRIEKALERFPNLPSTTAKILDCSMYPYHMVPVIDLATRFAVNSTGHRHLLATTIHEDLNQALMDWALAPISSSSSRSPDAPTNILPFQRAAVPLARFLIKGQPLSAVSHFINLHNTILSLSSSTIDATTKHETGLYCIEVLRCLKKQPAATDATAGFDATNPKFVAAVLHLVSSPSTEAARSQGIFGLTLLLSCIEPVGSISVEPVLAVARTTILPMLREATAPGFRRAAAADSGAGAGAGALPRLSAADQDNLKALAAQIVRVAEEEKEKEEMVEMKREVQRLLRQWSTTGEVE